MRGSALHSGLRNHLVDLPDWIFAMFDLLGCNKPENVKKTCRPWRTQWTLWLFIFYFNFGTQFGCVWDGTDSRDCTLCIVDMCNNRLVKTRVFENRKDNFLNFSLCALSHSNACRWHKPISYFPLAWGQNIWRRVVSHTSLVAWILRCGLVFFLEIHVWIHLSIKLTNSYPSIQNSGKMCELSFRLEIDW